MHNYHQPLLPGETYHLFNRAIGNEQVFKTNDNYRYFLKKYADHLTRVCETYCYCLIPNHFHFMIRICEMDVLLNQYLLLKRKLPPGFDDLFLSDFVMEQFSNFLNGYTKAFNKMFQRRGGLFIDFTKRTLATEDNSFSNIVHYIHSNPVHHGLCKNIEDWKFSSYNSILSELPTKLLRKEVIEQFGSKENFIQFHQQPIDFKLPGSYD